MQEQDWSQDDFISYMKENQLNEQERYENELNKKIDIVFNNENYFDELFNLNIDPDRQQWQTDFDTDEWEMIKEVWETLSSSKDEEESWD